MHLITRLGIALALAGSLASANAQDGPLFSASSKAQGAPFDLLATETQRLPSKSYLSVPGFHGRSAPASRWLMCVYTALAVQRGFSHWFVVYPAEGSDRVVLAFSNSPTASPLELLEADYVKERAIGNAMVPVEKMAMLCGSKPQP